MDHNSVSARLNKRLGARKGVVHSALQNKAFDTRYYHKVVGELSLFARGDLRAEVLDRILGLNDLCAEQRVLFKSGFVLDDNRRNAHALQSPYVVHKVLGKSARVAVKDDRLGRYLHNVVYGTQARGHVYKLDVGLASVGAVAEGRNPHRVKLVELAVLFNNGFLGDKSGKTAVSLDRLNDGAHPNKVAQPSSSVFGHRQLFFKALIDFFNVLIVGVGNLNKLAAVFV